jgi:cysteine desulfurase / selenocysteine lyase
MITGDFPVVRPGVRGKRLVYLDNAATTQKPHAVIDRVSRFYAEEKQAALKGLRYA